MITSLILNEINDDEKITEVQTSRFKNFEKKLKSIEKIRRRIANANIYLTTK